MLADLILLSLSGPSVVYSSPADGFDTFRIPSLFMTQKGTLLAACEGRASQSDQANNSIVLKISTDKGAAWSKMQVLARPNGGSFNNPCIVQAKSGRLIMHYQEYQSGAHEFQAQPGYEGKNAVLGWQMVSTDEGRTWSKPEQISRQIKFDFANTIASGPGIGIRLEKGRKKGRLLMPYNHRVGKGWTVYCAYSDDEGRTWKRGTPLDAPAGVNPNEVQVVELAEGGILLNARNQASGALRCVALSHDAGETFSRADLDNRLIDPICQASILRLSWPSKSRPGIIAFTNPNDPKKRQNGTVRFSFDEGRTWPASQVIEANSFQYSCLAATGPTEAAVLYESVIDNKYQILLKKFGWQTN